jgi:topoisomerase-4 subunit A
MEESVADLRKKLAEVEHSLAHLTTYAVNYFKDLLKKYGKQFPRKTEISSFAPVSVSKAAVSNLEIFLDRKEGFVGTSLKGMESLGMASEFSEILTLSEDGTMMVHKACDKMFVGKNVLHAGFYQNNERCVYHLIYRDGRDGPAMAKRFQFKGYIRNKMYDLTKGTKNSKILYFSENQNGEQEKVRLQLKASPLLKTASKLDVDFGQLAVKGRQLVGTELTPHKVDSVIRLLVGASTLQAQRVWFDRKKNQLNTEGDGAYLGKYSGTEQLIAVYSSGSYEIIPFDWKYHFSPDLLDLRFLSKALVLTVEYIEGAKKDPFSKRVDLKNSQAGRFDFVPRRGNVEVRKVEWSE